LAGRSALPSSITLTTGVVIRPQSSGVLEFDRLL
jgi:hypothetical protein